MSRLRDLLILTVWDCRDFDTYGELTRMTQFKDKSSQQNRVTSGLLNYTILMAADILLYQTSLVPVGEDQMQHLELTRRIAQKFNAYYEDFFIIPKGFTPQTGARIRNLIDPTKKMDKSDPDPRTLIALTDVDEVIAHKIRKAKTDPEGNFNIQDKDSGISNLVTIFANLTGKSQVTVVDEYSARGYRLFKDDLVQILIETIRPIRNEYSRIREDEEFLGHLLEVGKVRSLSLSQDNIVAIRKIVGLAG